MSGLHISDHCTCQGGEHQPSGAQLRANDCPIHGLSVDDDDDWGKGGEWTYDYTAALDVGRKVIEMAERVKVANACAPGAAAVWAFEMDGVRYQVEVTVSSG